MSLVLFQIVGQQVLIAQTCIVNERNTCNPVAMLQLAISLNIVLTTSKVPHEITPVHKVALIGEEESDILEL